MKRRLRAWKTPLSSSVAIVAFAVFLVLALTRLVQIEEEMKQGFGENPLFALLQAQLQASQLAFDAAILDSNPQDPRSIERVLKDYDLLLSRHAVLMQGFLRKQMEDLGVDASLKSHNDKFVNLEKWLNASINKHKIISPAIAALVQAFNDDAEKISNRFVAAERAAMGERRDRYGLVFGILASGAIMSLRLFQELRRGLQSEAKLRAELDFSALLLNSSNDGIAAFDSDARCTHWNDAMNNLFGIRREEMIGKSIFARFGPTSKHPLTPMIAQTLAGENTYQDDYVLRSGQYVEITSFPLWNHGKVTGGIAFVRDITDRYHARRKLEQDRDALELLVKHRTADLRDTEQQLRAAINTAPDGFAAFDREDMLILANPRIGDFFPDTSLFEFGTKLNDVVAGAKIPIQLSGDKVDVEVKTAELQLESGIWLLVTLRRCADRGSVMRFADVTTYKQSAATLQSALEQEQSLRELYRGFVSMVSHQFRTPLAIIDSSAQRMMRRGASMTVDEIQARTEKIRSSSTRMAKLIDGILNAALLEAGRINFSPVHCDLERLIREICERQRELTPLRHFNLALDGLPKAAFCDPVLMEQAVGNLISNAAKYSPESQPIDVTAQCDNEKLAIIVRDRGVGVPRDEVSRLFERFFRARTAAGIQGTGIGLHVAHQIARMHGGDISVETEEGSGAAFTLQLPFFDGESAKLLE
jgi:PAS domain S-box-containing protein